MFNPEIRHPQFRETEASLLKSLLPTAPAMSSSDSPTDSPQMNTDTIVKFC